MSKALFLIGGGGHCASCIDVIESTNEWKIKGIFDSSLEIGEEVLGYPVIGRDEDIQEYSQISNHFLITVGQIKSAAIRIRIAQQNPSLNWATIISDRAYVAKSARLAPGVIVMHDSLVNANATIGDHTILNTKSVVEHDASVQQFCHISTGAIVNGGTKIEREVFVGSLATTRQGITIPSGTIIQAGSFFNGKS